jgi:phage shock protein PspC (stress-responsive transcriptional regulator)
MAATTPPAEHDSSTGPEAGDGPASGAGADSSAGPDYGARPEASTGPDTTGGPDSGARPDPTGEHGSPSGETDPLNSNPGGNRFFTWVRNLGLRRDAGWVGGVCTGIADRIGIDPLIVRGVFVVVAILGGPALFVYAIAWMLLPDRSNVIHLEHLFAGRFTSGIAGAGALLVLSVLPLASGFWSLNAEFWGAPYWGETAGRTAWGLVVLGLLVALVVWLVKRNAADTGGAWTSSASAAGGAASTSTDSATGPRTAEGASTVSATGFDTSSAPLTLGETGSQPTLPYPEPPAPDAPAEDFEAWRERQAAWKAESDAFRAQEAASEREIAAQRAEALRVQRIAIAEQNAERRRLRKLAKPRLSAAWTFAALGAATVAGGIGAAAASADESSTLSPLAAGFAVATMTIAVAVIGAGLARRRSGFLSFVALVLVLVTVSAASVPTDRQYAGGAFQVSQPGSYAQPAGSVGVYPAPGARGTIDIWQGLGTIDTEVLAGTTVRFEVIQRNGSVQVMTANADGELVSTYLTPVREAGGDDRYSFTVGDSPTPDITVRASQTGGVVVIRDLTQIRGDNR